MSKFIISVFRTGFQSLPTGNVLKNQIGRWCVPGTANYTENATLIMDMSNEDHCGACGNNLLNTKNITDKSNIVYEQDIYYYPYTM